MCVFSKKRQKKLLAFLLCQCRQVSQGSRCWLKHKQKNEYYSNLKVAYSAQFVIWIITLLWHTNKTRLQANVLGRTPVSFTDTLDTARFNAPVFQQDVSRLVLFKCTMFSIMTGLCNKRCKYNITCLYYEKYKIQ